MYSKIEKAVQSNPKGSDMKLIGIKDSVNFKEQVLNQREGIQSNSKNNNQAISTNEETNVLLEEIRDLLNEIKTNNPLIFNKFFQNTYYIINFIFGVINTK